MRNTGGSSAGRGPGDGPGTGCAGPRFSAWCLDLEGESFAVFEVPTRPPTERVPDPRLSRAEQEVAGLMVAGLSNQAIARRRATSPRTVANQAASIFRKLGVGSRAGLSAWMADAVWQAGGLL